MTKPDRTTCHEDQFAITDLTVVFGAVDVHGKAEKAIILTASAMVRTDSGWHRVDANPSSSTLEPFEEYG